MLLILCMWIACSGEDTSDEVDTTTPDASDTTTPDIPEDETNPDPVLPTYWPGTEEWATITPEEAGAQVDKLNEAIEFAEPSKSGGLVITRHGDAAGMGFTGQLAELVAEAFAE